MQGYTLSEIALYGIGGTLLLFLLYKTLRSFLADPHEFMTTLGIKIGCFIFGIFKFVFHVVQGIIVFILGIVYAVFPIDFIPDLLIGIGQIDDILVLMGTFSFLVSRSFTFPKPDPTRQRKHLTRR